MAINISLPLIHLHIQEVIPKNCMRQGVPKMFVGIFLHAEL